MNQTELREITVNGLKRKYRVHFSSSETGLMSDSVVFLLHGRYADGKFMEEMTGFSGMSDRYGFTAIYPDGLEKQWNDGRQEISFRKHQKEIINKFEFLNEILNDLQKRGKTFNSVFGTGISNGGILLYKLLVEHPHFLNGAGIISAGCPDEFREVLETISVSKLIIFQCTSDPIIPYNGGKIRFGRTEMGNVISTEELIKLLTHDMNGPNKEVFSGEDNLSFEKNSYNKDNSRKLIYFKISGGGHIWPGSVIEFDEKIYGNSVKSLNAGFEMIKLFMEN
ncbi:MAG: hypothetical protein PHV06_10590 [bacterium]|nr:hypothetical protein [bacterium]